MNIIINGTVTFEEKKAGTTTTTKIELKDISIETFLSPEELEVVGSLINMPSTWGGSSDLDPNVASNKGYGVERDIAEPCFFCGLPDTGRITRISGEYTEQVPVDDRQFVVWDDNPDDLRIGVTCCDLCGDMNDKLRFHVRQVRLTHNL